MTTNATVVPDLNLNDGNRMPQLGFGVFLVPEDETAEAIGNALRTRLSVDRHRRRVRQRGRRPRRRGDERARPRRHLHHDQAAQQRPRAPQRAARVRGEPRQARRRLHRPLPDPLAGPAKGRLRRDLGGIVRAAARGARPLDRRLELPGRGPERIIDATGVVPAVNQIELHPRLQQLELRRFHEEHGIKTEAWSPLGKAQVLDEETIERIASAHGRTPAQVVLRWHIQLGNIVIPKSVTPSRIEENFNDLRFRAERRGHARDVRARSRRAHRPRPRHVRVGLNRRTAPMPRCVREVYPMTGDYA